MLENIQLQKEAILRHITLEMAVAKIRPSFDNGWLGWLLYFTALAKSFRKHPKGELEAPLCALKAFFESSWLSKKLYQWLVPYFLGNNETAELLRRKLSCTANSAFILYKNALLTFENFTLLENHNNPFACNKMLQQLPKSQNITQNDFETVINETRIKNSNMQLGPTFVSHTKTNLKSTLIIDKVPEDKPPFSLKDKTEPTYEQVKNESDFISKTL